MITLLIWYIASMGCGIFIGLQYGIATGVMAALVLSVLADIRHAINKQKK